MPTRPAQTRAALPPTTPTPPAPAPPVPTRAALPPSAIALLLIAGVLAVVGILTTTTLWTSYLAAAGTTHETRASLDAALAEARAKADAVIAAQDEAEQLREFAEGHAECLRVNPWSPLCNNWGAETALAGAEESLSNLEGDMDLAFARAAVVRIPHDAARTEADSALAAFTVGWVGAGVLVLAVAGAAVWVTARHRRREPSTPS